MLSNTLPPLFQFFDLFAFSSDPVLIVAHASSPSSLGHQNNIRQIARHSYLLPDLQACISAHHPIRLAPA